MVDSGTAHSKEYFPELLLPVSLSLWWATATPHLCRRPSNTSRYVWFSFLLGHCSFLLGPDAHTTLCVPSKSGVSVSPSPVKVLQSYPTRLQSLILWEFFLPLLDPQVGKPDVGLRTFTPVGGLLWYNCSPVCESTHTVDMESHFIVIAPLLPSHCSFSFVFGSGISFWWVPVSSCQWLFSS